MGPFQFLNGAFLAAMAAAALPILIHLFSRRRARELPFSQVQFLEEITRRKIRRMRLRQWILLALRTLAIALIALAFSRPVWHGGSAFHRERGPSTVAILLDDSYSMEARMDPNRLLPVTGGGVQVPTRFEAARQRALQVLDLLDEGDRAILVFTASPIRVPYESTVRDPALLREEIERATPRASRSDLVGALERVHATIAGARTLNREIFVVSDFQQNQMAEILRGQGARAQETAPAGAADSAGRLSALVPIPEKTQVYLLPVEAPSDPNVAVVWSFFERAPTGSSGRLTVRVRNLSPAPVEEAVLQVFGGEGERLLAEGFVSIEPEGLAQTEIALPEMPAEGRLVIRSAPDILERDNVRYLSTTSVSRFRVLLVTGGSIDDPQVRAEATYPILALDPWGGETILDPAAAIDRDWVAERAAGLQLFEIQTVAESDLGLGEGLDYDAVMLLNVGRLSATAVEMLERYRAEGGNLLISLGDRVDARTYNTQILARLSQTRLENVVGDLRSETYFSFRPAVAGHDIYDGFPLAPGEALSSARFHRIQEVRPGADARVLAEFSGGYPALIEEPGLLLFTSSLDLRWSDFPTSASYLPFLHRSLLHLILQGRVGRHEPLVGDVLTYPLSGDDSREDIRCLTNGGIELPVQIRQTDRGASVRTDPVPAPGFYRLVNESRLAGESLKTVAVNVDMRESDLAAMPEEEMPVIFGSDAQRLAADEPLSRQVLQARYGQELWQLCLVLAFLMLLAESLVARGRLRP